VIVQNFYFHLRCSCTIGQSVALAEFCSLAAERSTAARVRGPPRGCTVEPRVIQEQAVRFSLVPSFFACVNGTCVTKVVRAEPKRQKIFGVLYNGLLEHFLFL
jgi:hypothetical protein